MLSILVSCSRKDNFILKDFFLKNYSEFNLKDEQYIDVKILKTFPKQKDCSQGVIYTTLYICKEIKTGDLLYVFDLCGDVSSFTTDKNFTDNVCIMKDNVKHASANLKITLFVPNKIKIPEGAKYICAKITRLND